MTSPQMRASKPGTGVLSPRQQQMLREMLNEQRHFRLDQLQSLRTSQQAATSAAQREVDHAVVMGAQIALHEIEGALARMDDGSYGRCVACDAPLTIERLEVLPQISLCMACQHYVEMR